MTWDESKDTNQTRPNVPSKEKITSADWNAMVTDQKAHSTRHEEGGVDELSLDTSQITTGKFADSRISESSVIQFSPTQAAFDDHSSRHESGGADTIDHDNLTGFVADEHVAHSGVNITAGAGLTGGGSIDTSRTIDAHTTTVETTDYTASETDIVLADASGGPLTVTLPAPSLDIDLHVKKIDSTSNNVTLATPGTETIDGDNTKDLNSEYLSLEITSDGDDFYVLY